MDMTCRSYRGGIYSLRDVLPSLWNGVVWVVRGLPVLDKVLKLLQGWELDRGTIEGDSLVDGLDTYLIHQVLERSGVEGGGRQASCLFLYR